MPKCVHRPRMTSNKEGRMSPFCERRGSRQDPLRHQGGPVHLVCGHTDPAVRDYAGSETLWHKGGQGRARAWQCCPSGTPT